MHGRKDGAQCSKQLTAKWMHEMTTEQLTLQTVHQLKSAWQKEHSELLHFKDIASEQQLTIDELNRQLSQRNSELQVETINFHLAIDSAENRQPQFAVANLVKLLHGSFDLLCCVKLGVSWTVWNASNDNFGTIAANSFSNFVANTESGRLLSLTSVLTNDDISQLVTPPIHSGSMYRHYYLLTIHSHCCWIVFSDLDDESDYSTTIANELAELLPAFECTSHLMMSGVMQYFEHQELVRDSVCSRLYCGLASLTTGGSTGASDSHMITFWTDLAALFTKHLMCASCEVYISNFSQTRVNGNDGYLLNSKLQLVSLPSDRLCSVTLRALSSGGPVVCNDIDAAKAAYHHTIDCGDSRQLKSVLALPLVLAARRVEDTGARSVLDCTIVLTARYESNITPSQLKTAVTAAEFMSAPLTRYLQDSECAPLQLSTMSRHKQTENHTERADWKESQTSELINGFYWCLSRQDASSSFNHGVFMDHLMTYLISDWAVVFVSKSLSQPPDYDDHAQQILRATVTAHEARVLSDSSLQSNSAAVDDMPMTLLFSVFNELLGADSSRTLVKSDSGVGMFGLSNVNYWDGFDSSDVCCCSGDMILNSSNGLSKLIEMDPIVIGTMNQLPCHVMAIKFRLDSSQDGGCVTVLAGRWWNTFSSVQMHSKVTELMKLGLRSAEIVNKDQLQPMCRDMADFLSTNQRQSGHIALLESQLAELLGSTEIGNDNLNNDIIFDCSKGSSCELRIFVISLLSRCLNLLLQADSDDTVSDTNYFKFTYCLEQTMYDSIHEPGNSSQILCGNWSLNSSSGLWSSNSEVRHSHFQRDFNAPDWLDDLKVDENGSLTIPLYFDHMAGLPFSCLYVTVSPLLTKYQDLIFPSSQVLQSLMRVTDNFVKQFSNISLSLLSTGTEDRVLKSRHVIATDCAEHALKKCNQHFELATRHEYLSHFVSNINEYFSKEFLVIPVLTRQNGSEIEVSIDNFDLENLSDGASKSPRTLPKRLQDVLISTQSSNIMETTSLSEIMSLERKGVGGSLYHFLSDTGMSVDANESSPSFAIINCSLSSVERVHFLVLTGAHAIVLPMHLRWLRDVLDSGAVLPLQLYYGNMWTIEALVAPQVAWNKDDETDHLDVVNHVVNISSNLQLDMQGANWYIQSALQRCAESCGNILNMHACEVVECSGYISMSSGNDSQSTGSNDSCLFHKCSMPSNAIVVSRDELRSMQCHVSPDNGDKIYYENLFQRDLSSNSDLQSQSSQYSFSKRSSPSSRCSLIRMILCSSANKYHSEKFVGLIVVKVLNRHDINRSQTQRQQSGSPDLSSDKPRGSSLTFALESYDGPQDSKRKEIVSPVRSNLKRRTEVASDDDINWWPMFRVGFAVCHMVEMIDVGIAASSRVQQQLNHLSEMNMRVVDTCSSCTDMIQDSLSGAVHNNSSALNKPVESSGSPVDLLMQSVAKSLQQIESLRAQTETLQKSNSELQQQLSRNRDLLGIMTLFVETIDQINNIDILKALGKCKFSASSASPRSRSSATEANLRRVAASVTFNMLCLQQFLGLLCDGKQISQLGHILGSLTQSLILFAESTQSSSIGLYLQDIQSFRTEDKQMLSDDVDDSGCRQSVAIIWPDFDIEQTGRSVGLKNSSLYDHACIAREVGTAENHLLLDQQKKSVHRAVTKGVLPTMWAETVTYVPILQAKLGAALVDSNGPHVHAVVEYVSCSVAGSDEPDHQDTKTAANNINHKSLIESMKCQLHDMLQSIGSYMISMTALNEEISSNSSGTSISFPTTGTEMMKLFTASAKITTRSNEFSSSQLLHSLSSEICILAATLLQSDCGLLFPVAEDNWAGSYAHWRNGHASHHDGMIWSVSNSQNITTGMTLCDEFGNISGSDHVSTEKFTVVEPISAHDVNADDMDDDNTSIARLVIQQTHRLTTHELTKLRELKLIICSLLRHHRDKCLIKYEESRLFGTTNELQTLNQSQRQLNVSLAAMQSCHALSTTMISSDSQCFDQLCSAVSSAVVVLFRASEASLLRVSRQAVLEAVQTKIQAGTSLSQDSSNPYYVTSQLGNYSPAAIECLISNAIVLIDNSPQLVALGQHAMINSGSDGKDRRCIGHAFLPLVSPETLTTEHVISSASSCHVKNFAVIQIKFSSVEAWQRFKQSATIYTAQDILGQSNVARTQSDDEQRSGDLFPMEDRITSLIRITHSLVRSCEVAQQSLTQHHMLSNVSGLCDLVSGTLENIITCLDNRSLYTMDALSASVLLCFGKMTETMREESSHCSSSLTSARLHWQVDDDIHIASSSSSTKQAHVSQLTFETSYWKTVDLVEESEEAGDSVLGLSLPSLLRLHQWQARRSHSITPDLHKQVCSAAVGGLRQAVSSAEEVVWLVLGNNQQAILEVHLSKEVGECADDSITSVVKLIGECLSQCVTMLSQLILGDELLQATEAANALIEKQSAVLGQCTSELTNEGAKLSKVLSRVQSLLLKLPGVESVVVECNDIGSGTLLYSDTMSNSVGATTLAVKSTLISYIDAASNSSYPDIDDLTPLHGRNSTSTQNNLMSNNRSSRSLDMSVASNRRLATDSMNSTGGFRPLHSTALDLPVTPPCRGTEYGFECYEIKGKIVVFHVAEHPSKTLLTAMLASVFAADSATGGSSAGNSSSTMWSPKVQWLIQRLQSSESATLEAIARATARRAFELHRGHKNKQMWIQKQEELQQQRTKLANTDTRLSTLESSRAIAVVELEKSHDDIDQLRLQLQQEMAVSQDAVKQHRALSAHMRRVLSDLRAEHGKKEGALQRQVQALKEEHRLALENHLLSGKDYGKLRKELARALEKEKSNVDTHRELTETISKLEKQQETYRQQIANLQQLLSTTQADLTKTLAREDSLGYQGDAKLKVLVGKLQSTEEELTGSRRIIQMLREQLDHLQHTATQQEESFSSQLRQVSDQLHGCEADKSHKLSEAADKAAVLGADLKDARQRLTIERDRSAHLGQKLVTLEKERRQLAAQWSSINSNL